MLMPVIATDLLHAGALASWLGPEGAILISAVVMLALLGWVLTAHKLRLVHFDLAAQDSDDPAMAADHASSTLLSESRTDRSGS